MKTAEELAREWLDDEKVSFLEFVELVQNDALESAAAIADEVGCAETIAIQIRELKP